ncbi:heterokaryon incompatibility protein-domain-containing protein [Staphylotrichum tortipilum]|uniref:Heterokaryon incompatibility protein-domain-containing protein n=1 Tax=Staphylotrichum tortipilum TaxID=2831512 RepID=A0AAN6RWC0_9PEZI|nr:heterokaryon incompatibility protein-domain-containing protein [Staphylotrichum longicolle]
MDDPILDAPSPSCYAPLAPGFTRVFELEPGNVSDPIVGRLVPQAIDGEPYEAVSYVWGDTRNRRDITIDDVTLSVTSSLHSALTAFRHRPNQDGSQPPPVRRLWADAVCINQADWPERTSQVELMGRIFAGARRVLAWLGWEEGEDGRRHTLDAIRFIHDFMEDPEAGLRDARILLHHHDVAAPDVRLALLSEEDRSRFEEQARKWEAVKTFFEIEYFHRAWIVQELGLAREATMFAALRPAAGESGNDDHLIELDFVDWPLIGRFVKFLDYNGASLVTHLNLLSWVAHHVWMVWETAADGSPACDFLTGMHWTRILGVTDARDRVFALLGHPLAVLDGHPVIRPDYTVTRGLVYTKLAANFIHATGSLDVVNLVDHEHDPSLSPRNWDPHDEARMPSWVPDWHSINRTTPMPYPIAACTPHDPSILISGSTSGAAATPLPTLHLTGWLTDTITTVSPGTMQTTDFPITNLTRELAKTNPFWLDHLWTMLAPPASTPATETLAVLDSLSLALALGVREKGQPASTVGPGQPLAEHRASFAAYVMEYHALVTTATPDVASDGVQLPERSVFERLPEEARGEMRRRARGASGGVFLECMTWPSMCRVVYKTRGGLVGMGARVTRVGDLVCRVRGSGVLMVLRRVEGGDGGRGGELEGRGDGDDGVISCAFVGPTVVPARMKEGVVDGAVFGEAAGRFRVV